MSDDVSSAGQFNRATVRTTKEIKAGLLRRAFDGQSKRSAAELIALIQAAYKRATTMSEEHKKILADINPYQTPDTPRSVLMLDTMARLVEAENPTGQVTRYKYNTRPLRAQNAPSSPLLQ